MMHKKARFTKEMASSMEKIRVLLVDDHEVVRRGLSLLLELETDIEVIGEAATGIASIQQAETLKPDIVLLDLRMPGMRGIQAARAIKQVSPTTRVLIVSGVDNAEEIVSALESNVDGYVLKLAAPNELVHAIRVIARGEAYIQPAVAKRLLRQMAATSESAPVIVPPQLTQRELEILRLVASNRSNKEIAADLTISEETVRSHIKRILQKLDQPNRSQAALTAVRLGLIELE
jgi:DNA-binding NarL/FixJ family response regulator